MKNSTSRPARMKHHVFANAVLHLLCRIGTWWPGGHRCTKPKNILVIRLGNVGDIIVALPTFHALRKLYPNARIALLTSPTKRGAPGAKEILIHDSTFDETFIYYGDESHKISFLRKLSRWIIASKFDSVVALPNQLSEFHNIILHLILAFLCGIRSFTGFKLVTRSDYAVRQVDRLIQSVKDLGDVAVEPFPWIQINRADKANADTLLTNVPKDRILIGMHCGAKRLINRWPLECFIAVGKRLIEKDNAYILLTGGANEKELTSQIAEGIGVNCLNLAAETAELTVLAAIVQQCRGFISNDTGIMHMAYAMGIPTVAIFSARFFPNIWFPYGKCQEVLRSDVTCQCCNKEVCVNPNNLECLKLITPDMVVNALHSLLRKRV